MNKRLSLSEKESIKRLYTDEKLSSWLIGKRLGMSHQTISHFLRREGLIRSRGESYKIASLMGRTQGYKQGNDNKRWQGGRYIDKDGYVLVLVDRDDFFAPMRASNGYVREHRLIVAKALNRCLLPWEVVHHKTGYSKDDNRYPETLELITDKRFHLVDAEVKRKLHDQEKKIQKLITLIEEQTKQIEELRKEIKLLQWQLKEEDFSKLLLGLENV